MTNTKNNNNNKKKKLTDDDNHQSSSSSIITPKRNNALHLNQEESKLLLNNRHTDINDHHHNDVTDNDEDDYDYDHDDIDENMNHNNYWDYIIDSIISYFAILGDSSISLFISFVLLLLSIVVSWYMTFNNSSDNNYNNNNNHNILSNHSSSNTYHHHHSNHQKRYDAADNFHHQDDSMAKIVVNHDDITNNNENNYNNYNDIDLGPIPEIDPPYIFIVDESKTIMTKGDDDDDNAVLLSSIPTIDMMKAYETDGAIAIRGLLSNNILNQLDIESSILIHEEQMKRQKQSKKNTQFYTVRHNVLFHNYHDKKTNITSLSSFAHLALHSFISSYAASFLHLNNNNNNNEATLRVIRDIFLAKDSNDKYTCGWHVDDMGFWPATPNSPGINAWIAFDDMPLNDSSGFALAVQSHNAIWKHYAYNATGASMIFPTDTGGYHNVSDMFQQRTGGGTCNIQHIAPNIHQRMEDTKRIYNIKRGDVIFHTRWLFHKTIPYPNHNDNNMNHVYRRYSIRYGSGSSTIIPPGYGTEYSVLYNPKNGGKTANEVCDNDNIPWYPIAWTSNNHNNHIKEHQKVILQHEFHNIVHDQFPIVEKLANERRNEMKPYLQRLASQQQRRRQHKS